METWPPYAELIGDAAYAHLSDPDYQGVVTAALQAAAKRGLTAVVVGAPRGLVVVGTQPALAWAPTIDWIHTHLGYFADAWANARNAGADPRIDPLVQERARPLIAVLRGQAP